MPTPLFRHKKFEVFLYLTPLSTILQLYVAVSFIGGGNQRKPQTCRNHRHTLSHNDVISTLPSEPNLNSTLVMIGTDCTGYCKSNYYTIMTMMAPKIKHSLNHTSSM